jgi:adenine deaminase
MSIQMATLNAAEYFRLDDLGAIAPGFRADIVVFDHLSHFNIKKVFKDGVLVAEDGRMTSPAAGTPLSLAQLRKGSVRRMGSVRVKGMKKDDLLLRSDNPWVKVIQLIPDQILTKRILKKIPLKDGVAHPNLREDILKIVVVERHHTTGNIGIGFVRGFGLKQGAIGSSVAHDSHNIVVVGTNDQDILGAINNLQATGGGLVAVSEDRVLASVPLPVAGLMADLPVPEVHQQMENLQKCVKALGCKLSDPFMTLSFLSLPVIPELKLTDKGLVDVNQFKIVPLFGGD